MNIRLKCNAGSALLGVLTVFGSLVVSGPGWAHSVPAGGSAIDGVWHGQYTSSDSPQLTNEILMFETLSSARVLGAYLSQSGSAGTASGPVALDNTYKLEILQPVAGCDQPSKGILTLTVNNDKMDYSFKSESCRGSDEGKGTANRYPINKATVANTPVQTLRGFWNGTYTSTDSPAPTREVLVFDAKTSGVTGIYLSKSGAAGVLTGTVTGNNFTLNDTSPSLTCPSTAVFSGTLEANGTLSYGFDGQDCQGNKDVGKGVATKAPAPLPWPAGN